MSRPWGLLRPQACFSTPEPYALITQATSMAQLDFSKNPNRFCFWSQNRNTFKKLEQEYVFIIAITISDKKGIDNPFIGEC